jgi:hypothetical protein
MTTMSVINTSVTTWRANSTLNTPRAKVRHLRSCNRGSGVQETLPSMHHGVGNRHLAFPYARTSHTRTTHHNGTNGLGAEDLAVHIPVREHGEEPIGVGFSGVDNLHALDVDVDPPLALSA